MADGAGGLAASRRPGRIDAQGRRPLWTYAHVPSGSPIDQTEAVTAVFERFAPGFRDIVVAARSVPAARLAEHNANYVGGDIGVGGNNLWHALAGPTLRLNPWTTPIDRAYLCSSATPPGGGVHGMAGYCRSNRAAPRVRHQDAAQLSPLSNRRPRKAAICGGVPYW